MQHDDSVYLGHMLDTARKVFERVKGRTREQFDADEDARDAIAHRVQIIGEAASRLSQSFRDANPQVPWHRAIGMRHRIVHGYMDVDYDILWQVATKSLPELIAHLATLVPPGPQTSNARARGNPGNQRQRNGARLPFVMGRNPLRSW